MRLNATEQIIANETMKQWRAYVKPFKGILTNNPANEFGGFYTYETYAVEILEGIIIYNDYKDILEVGEFDNIKEEVLKRVKKAVKKDREILHKLLNREEV